MGDPWRTSMRYAGGHGNRSREEELMKDFAGRVAVITGAGSGFGREFARIAAREGMKLMLADVQQDALDEAVGEARAFGAQAVGLCVGVSIASVVHRLTEM